MYQAFLWHDKNKGNGPVLAWHDSTACIWYMFDQDKHNKAAAENFVAGLRL